MGNTVAEAKIRKMYIEDVPAVYQVEKASFTSPWTEETYEHEMKHNDYAHYFVVEIEGEIVGYIGLWLVLDDAQVTNIAILPQYRGYKIGEKLFGFALQYILQQGANRLSLEVRVSNVAAQNLYRKFGLVHGGIRKNYYPDNGEDALVMWVNLQ